MGWRTAIKSRNVRAIVSYEPGSNFIFPDGEVPPPMQSSGGPLEGVGVPLSDFMLLTKIPIVIYYGDNIPEEPIGKSGTGPMAHTSGDGKAVGGRREQPRR